MRLAKYVWGGQGGDTQGRLAVLPPSLVAHLAERSVISRDSKGISKLPLIQLVLPYKISCTKGSLEVPRFSLVTK